MVRWPGKVPAGRVSNELVHTVDWYTTLLLAAGAQVPGDRMIDGMDMRGFLLGDAEESGRDAVLCMQGNRLQAVKWHQWKIHLFKQDDFYSPWMPLNEPWVINLEWDPREEHEVLSRTPGCSGPGRGGRRRVPEVAGGRAPDQAGDARSVHAAQTRRFAAPDTPADRPHPPVRDLSRAGTRCASRPQPRDPASDGMSHAPGT